MERWREETEKTKARMQEPISREVKRLQGENEEMAKTLEALHAEKERDASKRMKEGRRENGTPAFSRRAM